MNNGGNVHLRGETLDESAGKNVSLLRILLIH